MTTSPARLWAIGLAAVFLLAHVPFFPPSLEDLDSMNFALGVRDFDPSKHQPHPPGYPVFIALGKLTHAVGASDVGALAVWGAVFGALSVFPLLSLFRSIDGLDRLQSPQSRDLLAMLATLIVMVSPLFWFSALRPLSDIPGLFVALVAQACLASAFVLRRDTAIAQRAGMAASGRLIVIAALLAGLAIGIRTQTLWLTLPMLAFVLIDRTGHGAAGALLGSMMTFAIGVLAWAVPLVIASGGLSAYRAALAGQTAEQFHGLDILLSNPTPRRLAFGILGATVDSWTWLPLGIGVVGLALIGLVALLRRTPTGFVLLAAAVVPYAVFHLVVQEIYSRYAIPFVPVLGYLAVKGLSIFGRRVMLAGTAAIAVASLIVTLPAVRAYAQHPSPAFAAMNDLKAQISHQPEAVIAMHQGLARAVETQSFGRARILRAPPMLESRELAAYFHEGGRTPVWYLADPARKDLELIDPRSRMLHGHYTWRFPREDFISGVRPDVVDLVRIESPPGWFCEEGWHLTPETLNLSERLRRTEGVAYIRSRPDAAMLVIGGESTAPAGTGPSRVAVSLSGRPLQEWVVPAGASFFKRVPLDAGSLAGSGTFSRLAASYAAPDGRPAPIRLAQFAVASPGEVFFVQHAGWNEIEYNTELQRRWRWTTGRAITFVNSAGRDLTLTIAGESPLRYFDRPPNIVVRAGSRVLATAAPAADFEMIVPVPAAALADADGMIAIETDLTFVPNERSGSPDKRSLGLRLFTFDVR